VFAGVRWRAAGPVTPAPIVGVRAEAPAAASRPVVLPLQSVAASPTPAAPASSPAEAVTEDPGTEDSEPAAALAPALPPAPTAATKPALRRPAPVPARVVKKPAHKQEIAHRAPAAAKPAPAGQSIGPSGPRPLVRPGWRDPFRE
jgi:hypothetical protein